MACDDVWKITSLVARHNPLTGSKSILLEIQHDVYLQYLAVPVYRSHIPVGQVPVW